MSEQKEQAITFPETEGEGTDGRGTPGMIDEKNREAEAAEIDASVLDLDGDDSDGPGSTGILEEKVREARAGEAGASRSGGSGGILDD
jgi:hypothetical protein